MSEGECGVWRVEVFGSAVAHDKYVLAPTAQVALVITGAYLAGVHDPGALTTGLTKANVVPAPDGLASWAINHPDRA